MFRLVMKRWLMDRSLIMQHPESISPITVSHDGESINVPGLYVTTLSINRIYIWFCSQSTTTLVIPPRVLFTKTVSLFLFRML